MVPYEPSSNDFFGNHQELSPKVLKRWKRFLETEEANKLKNRIERKKKRKASSLSRRINKK